MKLFEVLLLSYAHTNLADTALEDIKKGLTRGAVFIAEALLEGSHGAGPYKDFGTIQNIRDTGPSQKIIGDILVTNYENDIRKLNEKNFTDVAVEIDYQTADQGRIYHVEYVMAYLRYSEKGMFLPTGETNPINFKENINMDFSRKECKQLEALGFTKENIKEAQNDPHGSFKDTLYDAQIIASANGLSEDEIAALIKENNISDADATYNADIIAAANEH